MRVRARVPSVKAVQKSLSGTERGKSVDRVDARTHARNCVRERARVPMCLCARSHLRVRACACAVREGRENGCVLAFRIASTAIPQRRQSRLLRINLYYFSFNQIIHHS